MNVLIRGVNPFTSILTYAQGGTIDCMGSRVQFENCRLLAHADGSFAPAVFCRAQQNGAASINDSGFVNCRINCQDQGSTNSYWTYLLAMYGCEHFHIERCHFDNYQTGQGLTFDPSALEAWGYSANFTGHTNSGINIRDTYIFNYANSGSPYCLMLGDQTTQFRFHGWIGGTDLSEVVRVKAYSAAAYSRARIPEDLRFDFEAIESANWDYAFRLIGSRARWDEIKLAEMNDIVSLIHSPPRIRINRTIRSIGEISTTDLQFDEVLRKVIKQDS